MFNILIEPLIRIETASGTVIRVTLPELLAKAAADDLVSFPGLRPHQRHAWHSFVVLLAVNAMLAAELEEPPDDPETWREALRRLTPDHPDDSPWSLVAPDDRPALLQPVASLGTGFKTAATPDELDVLVTSKNHDVKQSRLVFADPEEWLFALVTLQTTEGFLGSGNYGISRMNGGFSNRPGLSISPPGGTGAHIRRDIVGLLRVRDDIVDAYPAFAGFLVLVWLEPWDGTTALAPSALDPFYIEICRRVRLRSDDDGQLSAALAGSKVARIATDKNGGGLTGDPWTPVDIGSAPKALTVDGRGFHYKRFADILVGRNFKPAPLQRIGGNEEGLAGGAEFVARALVRGQGKTEGFHERRIHAPSSVVRKMAEGRDDLLARLAAERIIDAGHVRSALRTALLVLYQNGPEVLKPKDPNSDKRASPVLDRFESEIDRDFFEHLFAIADTVEERRHERIKDWLDEIRSRASRLLEAAETGSSMSSVRKLRAQVRARRAFNGVFMKHFKHLYPKETKNDAA